MSGDPRRGGRRSSTRLAQKEDAPKPVARFEAKTPTTSRRTDAFPIAKTSKAAINGSGAATAAAGARRGKRKPGMYWAETEETAYGEIQSEAILGMNRLTFFLR